MPPGGSARLLSRRSEVLFIENQGFWEGVEDYFTGDLGRSGARPEMSPGGSGRLL